MIFVAGMLCGAVVALIAYSCVVASHNADEKSAEPTPDYERLNAEKKEHERFMKEQQRQFDMLMKYTGEKQRG